MDGFGIRRGGVFPLVQDSEGYLIFLTNSNPDPNIVNVITSSPGTGPAAYPLPVRPTTRPHGGAGCGSGVYNNGDPVSVVEVVVFVVIVAVPVPEVDIVCHLW